MKRMRWFSLLVVAGGSLSLLTSCGGGQEKVKLSVISSVPADGAINVDARTSVAVTFNADIDETTLVSGLTVTGPPGTIDGGISYNPASHTAIFRPTTRLTSGATHTIEVGTGVRDKAGNALGQAFSAHFSVRGPAKISATTSATHKNQSIAFNANGDGLALWVVDDGVTVQVVSSSYSNSSGTWSAESVLAVNATNPAVASSGSGFMAVYEVYESGAYRLYGNSYSTGWGTATRISGSTAVVDTPKIAANPSDYMAVWTESGHINASRYTSSWSAPVTLDGSAYGAYYPQIACNGSGYAVAWSKSSAFYAAIHNGTAWAAEAKISTNAGGGLQIASNGSGYAAVWWGASGNNNVIYANIWNGSAWGGEQLAGLSTGWHYFPVIAGKSGQYRIAWTGSFGNSYVTYLNTHNGASWGTPAQIGNAVANSPEGPSGIAALADGCAVIWRENTGSGYSVHAYVLKSGTTYASTRLDDGNGDPFSPAMFTKGTDYFATWDQNDPDGFDRLRGSVFHSGWQQDISLVSSSYAGVARTPRLAADGAGTILAVWQQYHRGIPNTYGSFSRNGVWETPFLVGEEAETPAVASNGTGFMVAWHGWHSGTLWQNSTVARSFSSGVWAAPFVVSAAYCGVGVSLASNGTGYALAWIQYDNSAESAAGRIHDGTSWGTVSLLENAAGVVYSSKVVSSGSGYAFTWSQFDGSGYTLPMSVWYRSYSGSTFGSAVRIGSSSGNSPEQLVRIGQAGLRRPLERMRRSGKRVQRQRLVGCPDCHRSVFIRCRAGVHGLGRPVCGGLAPLQRGCLRAYHGQSVQRLRVGRGAAGL